jgi:hypothetical protein
VNWIKLDHTLFEAMMLKEFMTVCHKTHLLSNWQDDTWIMLSRMHQESLSFWEFQVAIQTINALLKGMPHYLDEQKICEHIEGGMDQVLYIQATNAKCNDLEDLHQWLAKVKHLDDEKHFECVQAVRIWFLFIEYIVNSFPIFFYFLLNHSRCQNMSRNDMIQWNNYSIHFI